MSIGPVQFECAKHFVTTYLVGGLPAEPAAGWPPAASRRSSTTSAPCSGSPTAATPSRRPPSSTAGRCSPPPRAAARAGYDGYKRRKGSKVHMAVDTLGHLLALHVTPGRRAGAGPGRRPGRGGAGGDRGLGRAGVRRPGLHRRRCGGRRGQLRDPSGGREACPRRRSGFVLLPRRWVVERSFGWMARFRRLARDYERLSETLEGLHYVAFSLLMLRKAAPHFYWSS